MNDDPASSARSVVRGIRLMASGQVQVERGMGRVLLDLATRLEEVVPFPVDVQHVVAAIVLSAERRLLSGDLELSPDDETLIEVLSEHVRIVFERYDGKLSEDD